MLMHTTVIQYPEKVGSVSQVLPELVDYDSQFQLVLIHGIADSPDVWRDSCSHLDTRFNKYFEMSLPWNSAVGDPISYDPAPEEVLRNVWRQLPTGKKVVFAHSFGANCLLMMAQQEMLDDVAAVVLLSVYYKPNFSDFSWPLFLKFVNEFDKFMSFSVESRPGAKNMSESSKLLIKDKAKEMYNPPSWIQFYQLFSTTPGLDLSPFSMPTLVMGGKRDFSIERSDIHHFAQRLPNSDFHYIEQCGHFAMLEDPQYTAKIIQNFLNDRNILCHH
jgi:pimeloyl-ACP methyl ester carboxylesterase